MRLFQALRTLWKGFVSIFIKNIAVANPEAAYEGAIQDRLEERARLLTATGELVGERNTRQRELARVEAEFAKTDRELAAAVRMNNAQVGSLLIRKKQALEQQLATLRPQVKQLEEAAKRVKSDVERFNRQIIELKETARINVARLRSAQAQKRILDMMEGLSIRGDDQMLQAIGQSIEAQIGEVEVRQELAGTDVERQLAEVQETASGAVAEDEFAQLRAAHEAQQGVKAAGAPGGGGNGGLPGKDA